jgi:hypothetical protein
MEFPLNRLVADDSCRAKHAVGGFLQPAARRVFCCLQRVEQTCPSIRQRNGRQFQSLRFRATRRKMNLAIQGSFEAYVWAALWHVSLGGLQAGALSIDVKAITDSWEARLRYAASLTGSAVSFMAWGLAAWVLVRDGVAAGIFFGVFSFAANVLTLIELKRVGRYDAIAQMVGFFLMPIFALKTLIALGVLIR